MIKFSCILKNDVELKLERLDSITIKLGTAIFVVLLIAMFFIYYKLVFKEHSGDPLVDIYKSFGSALGTSFGIMMILVLISIPIENKIKQNIINKNKYTFE